MPSPHLNWQPTEQEMIDALTDRPLDEPIRVVVPEGQTARLTMANNRRAHLEHEIGAEAAQGLSDAEMCDSMPYTLFPNFHPWGSYNRTCYRFRPYGNDPGLSIMECMILSPYEGDTPPKGAELKMVEMDTSWTTVPELGLLARVFDQDDAQPAVRAEGAGVGLPRRGHLRRVPGDQDPALPRRARGVARVVPFGFGYESGALPAPGSYLS